jgi:hypothetical protein
MKKLILIFFLILLTILLIKRKENFFTEGCRVLDITKPTENDFYQCFLDDVNTYSTKLRSEPTNTQVLKVKNLLGERIKNYFISLYIHGLEKDFRFIIAFVPSTYRKGTQGVQVISQNIRMKDFMKDGFNKGKYILKDRVSFAEKNNYKRTVNYMGKSINQVYGIFVGMGFKIALSNRANNFNGRQCTDTEYRASYGPGYCIPSSPSRFNQYLQGGVFYDYSFLSRLSANPHFGGGVKYHTRWRPRSNSRYGGRSSSRYNYYYRREARHNSSGCGMRPEQRDFQFQKSLDSCMGSCYGKSRSNCHTAYGDTKIKEIYIIPDEEFFNLFYSNNKKSDFLQNNTTALDKYHA